MSRLVKAVLVPSAHAKGVAQKTGVPWYGSLEAPTEAITLAAKKSKMVEIDFENQRLKI
jgi:hypothetical protein